MPGGIGPVSRTTILACTRRDRTIAAVKNANEIFYNLDSRCVFFDRDRLYLYFADSPLSLIEQTIRATLTGLRSQAEIEQMHLDRHKCFTGSRRVRLTERQAVAVLVALQFAGVRIAIS